MIAKYNRFELALPGPVPENPFLDVTLEAQFRQKNRVLTVPGFYDGDGIYRLRFLPDTEGRWDYCISANVPELDGLTGSIEVGPADPGQHGPVRVSNTYHFAYDDGTPYYPFGTTAYNWVNQPPEIVEQTWQTLAAAPFNKIRMSPFPKHYLYNLNEPQMYPFEGGILPGMEAVVETIPPFMAGTSDSSAYAFDYTRPNVKFWQYFDTVIECLDQLGIQCDLILFHPYDRWGFAHMPHEANLSYIKYMAARYSAYPNLWWSFANEWDLLRDRTVDQWEAYAAEMVKWDHVSHLRSIHNCTDFYDYSRGWITHCSIQRQDFHTHTTLTDTWRAQWRKPVVIDEVCYEGDLDAGFGNINGEEMTRRFWQTAIRGGYCTHGETYLRDDGVIWWGKGGCLTGTSPARIRFLRELQEAAPGPWDPGANSWDLWVANAGTRYLVETATYQGKQLQPFAEYMIYYFDFTQPRFRDFTLPAGHSYRVDVIDTWNMTITPLPGVYEDHVRVDLPARPYMAVRMIEVTD